ncbi:MAG TPA: DNA primase small subunit domain-containing protein [Nitrososphaerales archaeon]|nr:DNA primase small subunit domain-containing protein [Nitrososphaerales archaeon]
MNEATISFLKSAYKEYYFSKADGIDDPPDIRSREFGYAPFGRGMVRHLSFRSKGEVVAEVLRQAPSSVYCSNAKYEAPTLPMEEKGWKGAELIFDIDATDIPTGCKRRHDLWFCHACHASGRLPKPQSCPNCKKAATEVFHGTCEKCLGAAKDHARRVVDFLCSDFGMKEELAHIYFSGNRGYHLHVFDERFFGLDQQARLEIADYISGSGLPSSATLKAQLKRGQGARAGWMRRIAAALGEGQTGEGDPKPSVAEAIESQSAKIDKAVTIDVHRVFRLGGTLHGTSGMLKMKVRSLADFDPMRDPVVLSEEDVSLRVSFYPKFTIMGSVYGPFGDEVVSVPTYAAIGMLTRGLAEVA